MTLAPSPSPTPMGAEKERGVTPAQTPLSAFCDGCGKPRRARELNAVCIQERQSYEPRWVLICGECFTA